MRHLKGFSNKVEPCGLEHGRGRKLKHDALNEASRNLGKIMSPWPPKGIIGFQVSTRYGILSINHGQLRKFRN